MGVLFLTLQVRSWLRYMYVTAGTDITAMNFKCGGQGEWEGCTFLSYRKKIS